MTFRTMATSLALVTAFTAPGMASVACGPAASQPAVSTAGGRAQAGSVQHWQARPDYGAKGTWLFPPRGEPGAWTAAGTPAAAAANCMQTTVAHWQSRPDQGAKGTWLFPPRGEPSTWSAAQNGVSTPNTPRQVAVNHWQAEPNHGAEGTWLFPPRGEPGKW